jgi:4-amino-4-deoxy-L-arabinose transferase-like glycosyltransferase
MARRATFWLWLMVVAAAALSLWLAATTPYFPDEEKTYIPAAASISLKPGHIHLPLRLRVHPALVAYVVRASTEIFGESRLGYRALHVGAGILALLLVSHIARHWYGPVAGLWTFALFAFNEYHLRISSIATSHAVYLLFVALTLYAAHRLIVTERPIYWYTMAAAAGVGFYAKESSALFLAAVGVGMLWQGGLRWLRTPHPYGAALLFLVLVAPDVAWNLATRGSDEVTYADHFERIGGLGISVYPLAFYARSLTNVLPQSLFMDFAPEYETMNVVLGFSLLGAVTFATWPLRAADPLRRVLLTAFWLIFGFFTFIRKGDPGKGLDPVAWFWVEMTLLPAVIIAGQRLATLPTRWAAAAGTVVAAALSYAVYTMLVPVL